MRKTVFFGLGLGIAILATHPRVAAAQQRQLGPHEHGRGTLNIAIEAGRISMELEAPGVDIVGFEHAAKTARQKAALENAKKQLLAPQSLFKFPRAAGCLVADAKVDIEREEHEHDQGTEPHAEQHKAEAAAAEEKGHSNFHAEYAFTCNAPTSITAVEFGYFQAFAGAQKLEVNVITPKGQTKFEVSRAKPRIDLAGMM